MSLAPGTWTELADCSYLKQQILGLPCWSSGQVFVLSMQEVWFRSLVGEPRSHMLHGTAKKKIFNKKNKIRAFLVAQWYRICLPMQETQV